MRTVKIAKTVLVLLAAGALVAGCDSKQTKTEGAPAAQQGTTDKTTPHKAAADKAPADKAAADKAPADKAAADKAGPSDKAAAAEPTADVAKPTADKAPASKTAAPDAPPADEDPGLRDPSKATATAPATFKIKFSTTKGDFIVQVTRDWAPLGADRVFNLVKVGFFKDIALFRIISGFMGQFGIHGDPSIAKVWRDAKIKDDPIKQSNTRGMVTFAMAGKDTRTTQMFINFGNNKRLDGMGFPPFGKVVEGMDVVDKINSEYGEGGPRGRGPHQGRFQQEGNKYLKASFPNMDYITSATILK